MLELSEHEHQRRSRVWAAMAELFLDTETRPAVSLLALVCLESGYTQAELEDIWRHEVSPVLAPNLLSVAGEWAWADLTWMEEKIIRRRRSVLARVAGRLFGRLWARVCRDHWREACRLMDWLKEWPENERSSVAHILFKMTWSAYSDLSADLDTDLSADPLNPSGLTHSNVSKTNIIKIWAEGAVPLITALHVKLSVSLERGQAALDRLCNRLFRADEAK